MDVQRAVRVWAAINSAARQDGTPVSVQHVLIACVDLGLADGAALTLVSAGGDREPMFAVDEASREVEELQFALGEGPAHEALSGAGLVLVADLSSSDALNRWPIYAPAALNRGVRAVFAFPLQTGTVRAGVLDIYRRNPGRMPDRALADALICADAALLVALNELGVVDSRAEVLDQRFTDNRAEVHQAAGMVSVQLGVGVGEALVRLRGHAYRFDRRLIDVARDVVERRLRFTADLDEAETVPDDGAKEEQ